MISRNHHVAHKRLPQAWKKHLPTRLEELYFWPYIGTSTTMLETRTHQWHREGYLISTEHALLDPSAINEVLGSEMINWGTALPREELTRMLKNSLCFGLYQLPASTAEIAGL
jgi:hypothetical protein